jgi:hypothetical protein
MRWTIWVTKTHTGDLDYMVGDYSNRGHAVSRIRGLRRAAWAAGSEINYSLRLD